MHWKCGQCTFALWTTSQSDRICLGLLSDPELPIRKSYSLFALSFIVIDHRLLKAHKRQTHERWESNTLVLQLYPCLPVLPLLCRLSNDRTVSSCTLLVLDLQFMCEFTYLWTINRVRTIGSCERLGVLVLTHDHCMRGLVRKRTKARLKYFDLVGRLIPIPLKGHQSESLVILGKIETCQILLCIYIYRPSIWTHLQFLQWFSF